MGPLPNAPTDDACSRLEKLDQELESRGISLRHRPLEVFKTMFPQPVARSQRDTAFEPIVKWYFARYGDRARWDGIVGKIPLAIRGVTYFFEVVHAAEPAEINIADHIVRLPQSVKDDLTKEEIRNLLDKANNGTEAFHKLYDLNLEDSFLAQDDRALIRRALFDIEHAWQTFEMSGDTQNSIFHSHAASEKFLKVAFRRAGGSEKKFRRFGHNLRAVFRDLINRQSRFGWLYESVESLQAAAPSMEIRYSDLARNERDAAAAYLAALNICSVISGIWLFDEARGSIDSAFKRGFFYRDHGERTFYCKEVGKDGIAGLVAFQSKPLFGSVIAHIRVQQHFSCLYLQVSDSSEIAALEARLRTLLTICNKKVKPEEIALRGVADSSGSYVSSMVTVEVSPVLKRST